MVWRLNLGNTGHLGCLRFMCRGQLFCNRKLSDCFDRCDSKRFDRCLVAWKENTVSIRR